MPNLSLRRRAAIAVTAAAAVTAATMALSSASPAPAGGHSKPAGQYTYTVTHTWQSVDSVDDGVLYLVELTNEQWKPADTHDTWFWRSSTVSTKFFRASDRAFPEALPRSTPAQRRDVERRQRQGDQVRSAVAQGRAEGAAQRPDGRGLGHAHRRVDGEAAA